VERIERQLNLLLRHFSIDPAPRSPLSELSQEFDIVRSTLLPFDIKPGIGGRERPGCERRTPDIQRREGAVSTSVELPRRSRLLQFLRLSPAPIVLLGLA
jgi:hypothetical protein